MLRGAIDPKESPVYEYVRFIGNFKSLNNGRALPAGRRHVTRVPMLTAPLSSSSKYHEEWAGGGAAALPATGLR